MSRIIAVAVAMTALAFAPASRAKDRNSAQVSILEGQATNSTGGSGRAMPLAIGHMVYQDDVVTTGDGSRMELKLKDGSVIRVGPKSRLQLKDAYFGKSGEKKFSAKLLFGRVWSKVSGLVGGDSKFEVETDNAVAGVRGTTFRVDASTDKSVLVRVYAGSIAMAGGALPNIEHEHGKRKQISGPKQVTKDKWEKLVGKMMEMRVDASGKPSEPAAFTAESDAKDEWAAWNTALDEK